MIKSSDNDKHRDLFDGKKETAGAVEKVSLLYEANRFRHIIYDNRRGGFIYPPVNRRDTVQNFNLIACRILQNAISALRHPIMVTVNEMDRMDCLYRRNALGQIIENAD